MLEGLEHNDEVHKLIDLILCIEEAFWDLHSIKQGFSYIFKESVGIQFQDPVDDLGVHTCQPEGLQELPQTQCHILI